MKCQALNETKPCPADATHEVEVKIEGDAGSYIGYARVSFCEAHAAFEVELRAVEDAQPVYEENACPRCGRNGVVLPFDGPPSGEILIHTHPGTFALCMADKESLQ